jgi:hypothetical protein
MTLSRAFCCLVDFAVYKMMGPNGFANGAGYSGPTGAGGMMSLDNYASSTIPPSYSAAAALPFQQSQSGLWSL